MRAWLMAYDITDRRRLLRVYHRMKRHAMAIEYSVFWLEGTPADRLRCLREVVPLLSLAHDDLRVYSVPSRGLRFRLGRAVLPDGITWSGLPAGLSYWL